MTVVLLGPQRFEPTVADAARAIGVNGRIALVTAGWQEREAEDEDLSAHLGGRTVNLELHRRADEVFRRDGELAEAYRARQVRLRQMQDFYRVRMEFLVEAAHVVAQRAAPPELLAEEAKLSVQAMRVLDRHHIARCHAIHNAFWQEHDREARPHIAEQREAIRNKLEGCDALAIAGGHVATILNRMRLFEVAKMLGGRPLLAWSAGAMAVTQHVVLFNDFGPQGPAAPELLDGGLGLLERVVALPNPDKRLRLDDAERVALFAQRFRPARCLALPRRSWVVFRDGAPGEAHGVKCLEQDGSVHLWEGAAT